MPVFLKWNSCGLRSCKNVTEFLLHNKMSLFFKMHFYTGCVSAFQEFSIWISFLTCPCKICERFFSKFFSQCCVLFPRNMMILFFKSCLSLLNDFCLNIATNSYLLQCIYHMILGVRLTCVHSWWFERFYDYSSIFNQLSSFTPQIYCSSLFHSGHPARFRIWFSTLIYSVNTSMTGGELKLLPQTSTIFPKNEKAVWTLYIYGSF